MRVKALILSATFLVPFALWSQTSAAPAKVDPVLDTDIRKLMEVSGFKKLFAQQMSQMAQMMGQLMRTNKAIPAQAVDEFSAKFKERFTVEEVMNFAVPIYAKNFTDSEIKEIIAYQQSPIGRKVNSVMPNLQRELMTTGQTRGQELGQQLVLEISKEHPEWFKTGDAPPSPKP